MKSFHFFYLNNVMNEKKNIKHFMKHWFLKRTGRENRRTKAQFIILHILI